MRMLMLIPTTVRSSDAGLLLAQALEQEGCQILRVDLHEDLPFWVTWGSTQVRGRDPVFRASFGRFLFKKAAAWRPDVVFIYGSNWCISPKTIRRMKRRLGCKVAIWELNHRLWRGYQVESIPLYDHFFALDSYMVPVMEVAGATHVSHLPACADPYEHFPITPSLEERERYEAEICFIGMGHPDRIAMLRHLTHHKLRIYGWNWDDDDPQFRACVREEPVYGLKKTKIYASSQISLNVHRPHMIHGENFRVFEVAACGSVSFSPYKPDLAAALDPGREVVIYKDAADLREKAAYYLSHPDELEAIGRAARRRVLGEHTYRHRARTILDRLRLDDH